MRRPLRPLELVLAFLLVTGGGWLRLHHLGAPSLWWDELVHIRTADADSVGALWHEVRDGVAPGTGNAAAVPLDYLVLHAWLRTTARPEPARLERYYRAPSAVLSCAALPAMWLVARSVGGPVVGIVALALLATSMPHVLYAAEARFYSLYVLMTIANLGAFVRVVRGPDRPGRWALFAVVNVAYVMSGLYGLFPIVAECAVLAVELLRRWRRGEGAGPFVAFLASSVALAAVVLAYLAPGAITTVYPRGAPVWLHPFGALTGTIDFFASSSLPFAFALGLAVPIALVVARDRTTAPLLAVIALAIAAVPLIVTIAQWKRYYYHPRHAIFLLPMLHLASGLALAGLLERLAIRRAPALLAGAVLALAPGVSRVQAYVANPIPFFQQTKTYRDFAGLTRRLAGSVAGFPPDETLLLLAERNRPGHLANPVLDFYLEAYGIADRVALRGFTDVPGTLRRVARTCGTTNCRRDVAPMAFAKVLGIEDPFDQLPIVRRLLGLRVPPWRPGPLGGLGVIVWAEHAPPAAPPGFKRTALDGLALFEPGR